MADKQPKFIPAETNYGFGAKKRERFNAVIFSPEETAEIQRKAEEFKRKAEESKPVLRKGEQLTQDDKDELAILRQQITDVEFDQAKARSTNPVMNLMGEEARLVRENISAYDELEKQIDGARFDVEQNYGDTDAVERLRDLEEKLENLKHSQSGDANKTMIVKPLEFKKPGFLARLLGRK
ncbi:MAG: hypothetical protein G01um101413_373 [Parcubacteria group bacterium Gr01-1014_13]|nr:MAG: hypothetical protein G01um101413_373 [Parcubacteria group bacterium Gr01-1014_13]